MKQFYLKLVAGLLMVLGSTAAGAAQEKAVVLISSDGTERQELLSNVDRITLGASSLTLTTVNGTSESVDYKDVDRILIGAEWNSVKQLIGDGEIAVWPTVTTGTVNVGGLKAGDTVTVTDINGAAVMQAKADGALTSLSLDALPAGMYVLTTGNKSVKIIKK